MELCIFCRDNLDINHLNGDCVFLNSKPKTYLSFSYLFNVSVERLNITKKYVIRSKQMDLCCYNFGLLFLFLFLPLAEKKIASEMPIPHSLGNSFQHHEI